MTSPTIHPLPKRLWSFSTVRVVAYSAAILLGAEFVLFAPWSYFRIAEPSSYVGEIMARRREFSEFKTNSALITCLVIGDSRMAEGFSARMADELGTGKVAWFNGAISGSTPRTWRYLLDMAWRESGGFDFVFLPLPGYDGRTSESHLQNRELDLQYSAPLVSRFRALSYARSFSDSDLRERALFTVLFKSVAMKRDIGAFLKAPKERLEHVVRQNRHGSRSRRNYQGNPKSVAGLVHVEGKNIVFSPEADFNSRNSFLSSVESVCRDPSKEDLGYMEFWLGQIADYCQQNGSTLIVFRYPRGPFHSLYPEENDELLKRAIGEKAKILPASSFADLESPEFFFDPVHLNAVGRERFTHLLVAATQPFLQDSAIPPSASSRAENVVESLSEDSVVEGQRETGDNPWGKTVVVGSLPDLGPVILSTVPFTKVVSGIHVASDGESIRFRAKAGFPPMARNWNISDGADMAVSAICGLQTNILWKSRLTPEDEFLDIDIPVSVRNGLEWKLLFETSDAPEKHSLGDWTVWVNPVVEFSKSTESGAMK